MTFVYSDPNGAGRVLQETLQFVKRTAAGKLISKPEAMKLAEARECTPEDIKFSVPWWLDQQRIFALKGVDLPRHTTFSDHDLRDPSTHNPLGIYRKDSAGQWKPVLFKEYAMAAICSDNEYADKMANPKALRRLLSDNYWCPAAEVFADLIRQYNEFFRAHAAQQGALGVDGDRNSRLVRVADLYQQFLTESAETREAITNITKSNDRIVSENAKNAAFLRNQNAQSGQMMNAITALAGIGGGATALATVPEEGVVEERIAPPPQENENVAPANANPPEARANVDPQPEVARGNPPLPQAAEDIEPAPKTPGRKNRRSTAGYTPDASRTPRRTTPRRSAAGPKSYKI